MEHKRIKIILSLVLAVACAVVAVVLVSVNRKKGFVPQSAVDDLIGILAESGIETDPSVIVTKKVKAKVYVCGEGGASDYNRDVASLISGSGIDKTYATPGGEILVTRDGALFEMGDDYYFRYSFDGKKREMPDVSAMPDISEEIGEDRGEIEKTVSDFLARGSKNFGLSGRISVETHADRIATDGEKYYVLCSRTIDGVEVTGNTVVCSLDRAGNVTDASGVWCFLAGGEAYSAQLCDVLNILFSAGSAISAENAGKVRIESVGLCYSLYYYGGGEKFCLIPCWQVVTESNGIFIYNALDGTFYTKK